MAGTTDTPTENPALAIQAAILARPLTPARRMADAIRALAIDAVEAANSGHPGLPMGMADVATTLWTRFLKFDAADPRWPDRDRFVLSAGHGSMLLYALLHLTGQAGMTIEDIKRFRQLDSPAAGHPEHGAHPAIETTTGPLGQGLATAVGMALAERMLAARFGRSLVDHRTWVIASDGDLMEGISHEAIGLAGHLRLNKLTVLYDDNHISIDGDTALAVSDDVVEAFRGARLGHQAGGRPRPAQVAAALSFAMRTKKPTLIACRTIIGFGAPTKAGTAAAHGSALGAGGGGGRQGGARLDTSRPSPSPPTCLTAGTPPATAAPRARRAWLKRLAHNNMRAEFERAIAGRLPENWHEAVHALKAADRRDASRNSPPRQSSQKALEALVPATPELVGGSADLTGSNLTFVKGMGTVAPGNYAGRYIHFGIREHGMAAGANGMALHGGLIPYTGTFFVFTDYMRPAIRLGALMRQRVIHVLTHDSIGLGEDGPTHQPVEHLASLRAMPNLHVFRPADALETAECWELAIRRADGPSLLVLTRQALPAQRSDIAENRCARGGYVLAEADGAAPGDADRHRLRGGRSPWTRARRWPPRASPSRWSRCPAGNCSPGRMRRIVPRCSAARRASASRPRASFGWERWLGPDGVFIGMTGFGASAPFEDLYQHFGITAEAVVAAVKKRLG